VDQWRLCVSLLGHTVLDVEIGSPAAVQPPREQPADEAPGPVTDRRSAPITQIGFQSRRRWADGRDCW
jgi:hypothetical protein